MRIVPEFLETVAFICVQKQLDLGKTINEPQGTAFFVRVPDETDARKEWTYAVTARHCIEEPPTQDLYLRVTTVTGASKFGYKDFATRKGDWFVHDSADVAAMVFDTQAEPTIMVKRLPLGCFISGDCLFKPPPELYGRPGNKIGTGAYIPVTIGNDLFFPGLFVQSSGKERLLPIARFGNVARMPQDELIFLETKARGAVGIKAYLAESHSWGGHSGSPVFWHYVSNVTDEGLIDGVSKRFMTGRQYYAALLGLVSGHYDIKTKDQKTEINSGTAIVTPADSIRQLLLRDDLVQDRRGLSA